MRLAILLLALACVACGGGDEVSEKTRYERARAARAGLYAMQASPGGALAKFVEVRLIGKDVVCGTVDGQDGAGLRTFGVAHGDVAVEQPGDAASKAAVTKLCVGGPARRVVSRNAGFTDISVEDDPS